MAAALTLTLLAVLTVSIVALKVMHVTRGLVHNYLTKYNILWLSPLTHLQVLTGSVKMVCGVATKRNVATMTLVKPCPVVNLKMEYVVLTVRIAANQLKYVRCRGNVFLQILQKNSAEELNAEVDVVL